jgi:hypothetical protein
MLTLWSLGILNDTFVCDWASFEIARIDRPSNVLIELATKGPRQCLLRDTADFSPRPATLTYSEEFSLRAMGTFFDREQSVAKFAEWASRACIGQNNLSDPMVSLGYQLDHLLNDCGDAEEAVALVRIKLPRLTAKCALLVWPYVAMLANLQSSSLERSSCLQ